MRNLLCSMRMVTNRMQKIDSLVLKILSEQLSFEFPGKFFSLTMVHVSKDLSFAKVWVSSVDDVDWLVKHFNAKASDLRHVLAKELVARKVPRLMFVADKTEDKAARIDELIAQIDKKDE